MGLRRRRGDVSGAEKKKPLELVDYFELPEWMQDNEFIKGKYRPPMKRLRDCVRTAFFNWHNESVNIWSHALGFLFFLFLTGYTIFHITSVNGQFSALHAIASAKYEAALDMFHHAEDAIFENLRHAPAAFHGTGFYNAAKGALVSAEGVLANAGLPGTRNVPPEILRKAYRDLLYEHRVGMMPMLVGAMICCLGSALYHALWNHGSVTMAIFSRLDYCGIVFLIAGHSMMATYYTFYCRPRLALFYNIFVGCAAVPVVASFSYKKFESPQFRSARAILFVVFGFTSATPIAHSGIAHRFFLHHEFFADNSFLFAASTFYLLGAMVFATRWPERTKPGAFDCLFNSHQLLHVCVLLGAFTHWYGCYLCLVYRLHYGCSLSPWQSIAPL